jgi:hypothetical protein
VGVGSGQARAVLVQAHGARDRGAPGRRGAGVGDRAAGRPGRCGRRVEEFLENLPGSWALRGEGERLRLRATDQPEGWTVTLGPERFDWVGGEPDGGLAGAATRAVTVQATAAGLYLLLWRRRPPTDARVGVGGDRVLLAHWLQHSVIS